MAMLHYSQQGLLIGLCHTQIFWRLPKVIHVHTYMKSGECLASLNKRLIAAKYFNCQISNRKEGVVFCKLVAMDAQRETEWERVKEQAGSKQDVESLSCSLYTLYTNVTYQYTLDHILTHKVKYTQDTVCTWLYHLTNALITYVSKQNPHNESFPSLYLTICMPKYHVIFLSNIKNAITSICTGGDLCARLSWRGLSLCM